MANFTSRVLFSLESFTFPLHIEQVYYADAHEEPRWRIVLRREVHGQRISGEDGVAEAEGLFEMGGDVDHEGLLIPKIIIEENRRTLCTGRNIHLKEVFEPTRDDWKFLKRDVGDSGSSSNEEMD
jgi:hypothetical protein